MHHLTGYRPTKRLGLTGLALVFALGLGTAFGADSGPRHHAQGEYDSATAISVVVEGDDLIAIGERFSVSVGDLKGHNKLASDKIEIGQRLAIPGEAGATPAPGTSTQYEYSTQIPAGIAVPDSVESRLGTLNFVDGFPDEATAQTLYDNLDFQRAVQAFLLGMPAVSQVANRAAFADLGPANSVVPIFKQLLNARTLVLTGNDNTVYSWTWLDLTDGPIVLAVPPKVHGTANDMWQRWVVDVGITGKDKGQGGKYLFLPPGYKGEVPSEGFVQVVHSPTFGLWIPWRSFLVDGDPKPGVELVEKHTKIYPLGAEPATPSFPDMTGKAISTVFPTVYSDQTRSMIQTDQRHPAVSSQEKDLIVNADGSIDVWFGPKAPEGKEPNWVQTAPGTGWNLVLRLYGALEPWFDQTWRPGEIELQP